MSITQEQLDEVQMIGEKGLPKPQTDPDLTMVDRIHLEEAYLEGRAEHQLKSHLLLIELHGYLLRNYDDDTWDGTTRELLEDIAHHFNEPPIEWNIDDE